jgi:hypothetical protein
MCTVWIFPGVELARCGMCTVFESAQNLANLYYIHYTCLYYGEHLIGTYYTHFTTIQNSSVCIVNSCRILRTFQNHAHSTPRKKHVKSTTRQFHTAQIPHRANYTLCIFHTTQILQRANSTLEKPRKFHTAQIQHFNKTAQIPHRANSTEPFGLRRICVVFAKHFLV